MRSISNDEARELILGCDAKYVSQEQYMIYYDDFSGRLETQPYISHDCVVVKTGTDWHIHAISTDSDLIAAIDEVKACADPSTDKIMALTLKNTPALLADAVGSYKLVRGWQSYEDGQIRRFTNEDEAQICECCELDPQDTAVNGIGPRLAAEFLEMYRESPDMFFECSRGLFVDEKLVGFVQGFPYRQLGLTTINIYVNRTHRGKGYAKRLLNAICSEEKDMMYCYSCVKTNRASFETAKSCGFEFMGEYLFVK